MSYVFSFTFLSLPLIFTLHWWPLAFLILSPPLQNFHVVLPTKKCRLFIFYLLSSFIFIFFIFLFFISRSRSLSPFFSLSFAGLLPTLSFSLSFSCSIFQICEQDHLSKLNTLDSTDTETISAFRFVFIDSFVVSALQDASAYANSRQNNLEFHLGCHTC